MPRPIQASISISALAHNLEVARRAGGSSKVWAVVKASAYGHGLVRAAGAFAAADGIALLDLEEAVRLRLAGEQRPILLLEGFFKPQDLALLSEYRLTPVIHHAEQIAMFEKSRPSVPLDIYLKINSGMNRLGFVVDNVRVAWNTMRGHAFVRSLTLMTHFADADGNEGVGAQLDWFNELVRTLDGGASAPQSLANSAALLRFPQTRADWVRPGIMLYGASPFADSTAAELDLRPAMTLSSEIIATQHLQPGERVGYGFTYEVESEQTIGIVACGYADGYPRHAPSGTPVLVAGKRTQTIGRVSMDMLCVDITDIPEAYVGTPVRLWGDGLPVEEVAASAGTVSYELLCALAPRVPVREVP